MRHDEMISICYGASRTDSDSVNLGSNPSPPATRTTIDQSGNTGRFWPAQKPAQAAQNCVERDGRRLGIRPRREGTAAGGSGAESTGGQAGPAACQCTAEVRVDEAGAD